MTIAEHDDMLPACATEHACIRERPPALICACNVATPPQRAPVAFIVHDREDGLGLEPWKAVADIQGYSHERETADDHAAVAHAKPARGPQHASKAQGLLDVPPARISNGEGCDREERCLQRGERIGRQVADKYDYGPMPQIKAVRDQTHEDHGSQGQERYHERPRGRAVGSRRARSMSGPDDESAGEDGKCRGKAGKWHSRVKCEHRYGDAGEPEIERRRPQPGGQALAGRREREQAADEQLPGARRQEVECGIGRMARGPNADGEREDGQCDEAVRDIGLAPAPNEHEHEREQKIELLLDGEAPGVKERDRLGGRSEVSALRPEVEIADGCGCSNEGLAEAIQITRQEHEERNDRRDEKHHEERREEPADATIVEIQEREAPFSQLPCDLPRDQVAGQDEKNVHADEAAGRVRKAEMEENDGDDGDGAQAV